MTKDIHSVSGLTLSEALDVEEGYYKALVMKDGPKWTGIDSWKRPEEVVMFYNKSKLTFQLVLKDNIREFGWLDLVGNFSCLEKVA